MTHGQKNIKSKKTECVYCVVRNEYLTVTQSHLLGPLVQFCKATISFVMSVRPYGITRLPTRRIFMKFCVLVVFENMSRKSRFH
jgi:hypothetical protein